MKGVRDPLNFYQHHGSGGFKVTLSPLEDALAVYRQNRLGAAISAIRKSYPATEQLLGETLFLAMVREFAVQWRSEDSLDWAGADLLFWLQAQPRAGGLWRDFPFLSALMRWEWGVHKAYYAHRQLPVTSEECALWLEHGGPVPWQMNPGLTLVASAYPIDDIWQTLMALSRDEERELELTQQSQSLWAIWPTERDLSWEEVTPSLRLALTSVRHPYRALALEPHHLATLMVRQWLVSRGQLA
ncbi:putative DNA-binding domain-containing protein [Ferrimonas futtsuensis]|uniref:HvfC/BufC family peptide modification chaperone n=1 Tax=Ferrimonas futtsuensis TaxID=364764 RepID=UPI0003F8B3E0|nr:putative DNA-binding domain-containing protein [Ferrimonas futtsuensis]